MIRQFNKLFRAYIFDKNFKVHNAGGFPPDYMFWGKNPVGKRYDLYGESEDEVKEWINSNLSDEQKENFEVMVKFLKDTPIKEVEDES